MFKWVNDLINKDGDDIVLNEIVIGVLDTNTGLTTDTVTPHPMKAVITQYTTNELIEGVINFGDQKALIETDLIPSKTWTVEHFGDTYKIVNIKRITTQNAIVTYTLQLRK